MNTLGILLMKRIIPWTGSTKEEFEKWVDDVCDCSEIPPKMNDEDFMAAIATAHNIKKLLNGELP